MTNRLAKETSPYLLQHAENPVDWFPWGEEAFQKAKKEDKPIFLSIGYSTCHWCHVMEHESFEDEEVAEMLNRSFISIKVDREEHPDVDQIYMSVCHITTGRGGWPLSIFMTPEREPFFAATYIPKLTKNGVGGMMDMLPRINHLWLQKRHDLAKSTEAIMHALKKETLPEAGSLPEAKITAEVAAMLLTSHDKENGGLGRAPKFPMPIALTFLAHQSLLSNSEEMMQMVDNTLSKMRAGGIFDQIGYGFHRYSTDDRWFLPHFEKMLYDQALLATAYIEAYQAGKKEEHAETALAITEYLMRDMASPDGAFYTAEDADSEGEEGLFYLWTKAELAELLGNKAEETASYLGMTEDGNYILETEPDAAIDGKNIPHITGKMPEGWQEARQKMLAKRAYRVRPLRDDKLLTDWNALAISAFARIGRVLGKADITNAAVKAANHIEKDMVDSKGRLLHRQQNSGTTIYANLDDYGFLIAAMLELYRTTLNPHWLQRAIKLAQETITNFLDEENGGFFFSAAGDEKLIVRKKEFYDAATPAANGVLADCLYQLFQLTGEVTYKTEAENCISSYAATIAKAATGCPSTLMAIQRMNNGMELVITGDENSQGFKEMLQTINSLHLPWLTVLHQHEQLQQTIPKLENYPAGNLAAYLCKNGSCLAPAKTAAELKVLLTSK